MPVRSCRWLLDGLPHPSLLVDFDGRVVAANAAAGPVVGRELRACLDRWSRADEIAALATDDTATPGLAREFVVRDAAGRGAAVIRAARLDAPGAVLTLVTVEPQVADADLAARHAVVREALGRTRLARHEINNLLMGLLGHAELLGSAPELSPGSRRRVETIVEQARRIREQADALRRDTATDDD